MKENSTRVLFSLKLGRYTHTRVHIIVFHKWKFSLFQKRNLCLILQISNLPPENVIVLENNDIDSN